MTFFFMTLKGFSKLKVVFGMARVKTKILVRTIQAKTTLIIEWLSKLKAKLVKLSYSNVHIVSAVTRAPA